MFGALLNTPIHLSFPNFDLQISDNIVAFLAFLAFMAFDDFLNQKMAFADKN